MLYFDIQGIISNFKLHISENNQDTQQLLNFPNVNNWFISIGDNFGILESSDGTVTCKPVLLKIKNILETKENLRISPLFNIQQNFKSSSPSQDLKTRLGVSKMILIE